MTSPIPPPADRKAAAAALAANRHSADYETTPFGRRRASAPSRTIGRWLARLFQVFTWPLRAAHSALKHKGPH